ncbi:MAG TPA: hypothetical protein VGP84_01365 [Gemmatimonadaceae bacterium]|jgi:hypothetical protein|nr:hypothetical protein [Gemmatimonadaceae bacterium]
MTTGRREGKPHDLSPYHRLMIFISPRTFCGEHPILLRPNAYRATGAAAELALFGRTV